MTVDIKLQHILLNKCRSPRSRQILLKLCEGIEDRLYTHAENKLVEQRTKQHETLFDSLEDIIASDDDDDDLSELSQDLLNRYIGRAQTQKLPGNIKQQTKK